MGSLSTINILAFGAVRVNFLSYICSKRTSSILNIYIKRVHMSFSSDGISWIYGFFPTILERLFDCRQTGFYLTIFIFISGFKTAKFMQILKLFGVLRLVSNVFLYDYKTC